MTSSEQPTTFPLSEWEPNRGERVVRWNERDMAGTVIDCARYGHFADPYWRVSVRWDGGRVEHGIETSTLTREDGTQGRR
ncbi:hypothetical protein ABZY58_11210 [Micromonospora tulbaghiae]|uniref:hypothetical protein n=1 Tax=Micromonospora tulbaghiae TaxID=479978 RepID=UPI0033ADABAA